MITDQSSLSNWKGRSPDVAAQFDHFVEAEMVKAFISSIEYRHRFGQ